MGPRINSFGSFEFRKRTIRTAAGLVAEREFYPPAKIHEMNQPMVKSPTITQHYYNIWRDDGGPVKKISFNFRLNWFFRIEQVIQYHSLLVVYLYAVRHM